jgi:hypothetical protein
VEEGRSAALYSQRRRASSPSLAGWYLSRRVSGPVRVPARDRSTQTGPDPAVAGTYLLACSATGPTTDLPAQKKILPPPPHPTVAYGSPKNVPRVVSPLFPSFSLGSYVDGSLDCPLTRSQSCFSFVPLVFFGW